jgi:acetyl esterase/lipase
MNSKFPNGGQTVVYSTIQNHDIKLDYYLPQVTGTLPAIIYYHGGGMTAGSRRSVPYPSWLYGKNPTRPLIIESKPTSKLVIDHCQEKGYIFISADYRLCHPSTTLDQIEDAKACFKYIAGEEFARHLPQSVSLDTTRIAVSGFSAGAYSARAACVYANPKPAALLSVYGLGGNMLLDHWTTARPPTSIAKFVDLNDVPRLLADKTVVSDDMKEDERISKRFALTVRWELDGTFLDGCFGRPGLGAMLNAVDYSLRDAAVPDKLKPGILQSFVTEEYPPSVFVHGTADEVVSDQESLDHHEQLLKLGVKSSLFLVENGPHGLGEFSFEPDSEVSKNTTQAYRGALAFIDEVLAAL